MLLNELLDADALDAALADGQVWAAVRPAAQRPFRARAEDVA